VNGRHEPVDETRKENAMTEISVFRLYALRASYLLMAVGLGTTIWPTILDPTHHWALPNGIVASMLGALGLVALLGLRYPLQMLPLLFFEISWKMIWLLRVALPLWSAHQLDAATMETVKACLMVVIFPIVIPWSYVVRNYVTKSGDPWGRSSAPRA
jgi:hypothetical protein